MDTRSVTYPSESGLIEIASPVGMAGEDYVEDEQHQFITEHWRGLAAASYEGFRQLGIGAVIVEEPDTLSGGGSHPLTSLTVQYTTQAGPWIHRAFAEEALQWLDEQLQTYDPDEAGLFVFLREDAHPRLYRVSGTLPPPQAFRQVRAQLN